MSATSDRNVRDLQQRVAALEALVKSLTPVTRTGYMHVVDETDTKRWTANFIAKHEPIFAGLAAHPAPVPLTAVHGLWADFADSVPLSLYTPQIAMAASVTDATSV
jgi:hypothetical protein